MIDLVVPEIGESITEVVVSAWLKQPGETVKTDEAVAELESDKATVELPAPADGVMAEVLVKAGETAQVGDVIGRLDPAGKATAQPVDEKAAAPTTAQTTADDTKEMPARISPSARRLLAESGVDPAVIKGTGKDGMVLKEDVAAAMSQQGGATPAPILKAPVPAAKPVAPAGAMAEEVVAMSPIRRTIARRLLESQQTTAQLTTFNEVDMSAVIELRNRYKDAFLEKYGVKLGFMSFFVKAAIEALKAYPSVNAEIRGDDVAYKNYYNIGIAVGGGKGLVVPVLRNADGLSFAGVEAAIADFGTRGAKNRINLDELSGGTFSISNGGVYGSLMGTPILNPPQSGILGLHAIKERAVVVAGEVVARPMMYVALTYDHRIVDGRESVGFLVRLKEVIEDPARLFLEV